MRASPTWNRCAVADFSTITLNVHYIALVAVIAVLALPGLGVQPGVDCLQYPLGGLFDGPAFRG